jgi:hypothetical protein
VQPQRQSAHLSSGFAYAFENYIQEYLFDLLVIGYVVGVVPAVQPITHAQHAIDDDPGFALHEFALLLASLHQFDETIVVAGHHRGEFVLALSGKRIEFVEK